MTDLEKWEKFLTEMHIPFKTEPNKTYDFDHERVIRTMRIQIGIVDDYRQDSKSEEYKKLFGNHSVPSLDIEFELNGDFKSFITYGE